MHKAVKEEGKHVESSKSGLLCIVSISSSTIINFIVAVLFSLPHDHEGREGQTKLEYCTMRTSF